MLICFHWPRRLSTISLLIALSSKFIEGKHKLNLNLSAWWKQVVHTEQHSLRREQPLSTHSADVTAGGWPHSDVKTAPLPSDVDAQPCNFLQELQDVQAVGVFGQEPETHSLWWSSAYSTGYIASPTTAAFHKWSQSMCGHTHKQ